MRLIQFCQRDGQRRVAAIAQDATAPRTVQNYQSVRDLALDASREGVSLEAKVLACGLGESIDYEAVIDENRLLLPLDHPEPGRLVAGITGLTHLGSAQSRDAMHAKLASDTLSDSMKMFKLGVEGGKPAPGMVGVQPEWAYKGDLSWGVPTGWPLDFPDYAEDAGEEAEIVGLYVIGDDGHVLRVGFALGNEFSDHVMERRNYLYLAHSKLRPWSVGPELLIGQLPDDVRGKVRVRRNGEIAWEGEFLSGESNMCHSIANLEHHHFKYAQFRRPGDVHVYFYGASVLSHADAFEVRDADVFEVDCQIFGKPLQNPVRRSDDSQGASIVAL